MISAAALDALVAAGVSSRTIADVVKADMEAQAVEAQAAKAKRRDQGRERQRRKREKDAVSRDVTLVTRDERDTPSLSPSPRPLSTNLTPEPPIVPQKTAKPAKQSDLAEQLWAMANQDGRDRSEGKASVRRAVDAAIGRGATAEMLQASVRRHYGEADRGRRDEQGRTFAKGLHRWIAGDHWQAVAPQRLAEPADETTIARRLQHFRDTGQWKAGWGPPPEVGTTATFRPAA